MYHKSRCVRLILSLVAVFTLVAQNASAQSQDHPPLASELQSGDLIWPKKPGAIVPYDSRQGEANESEAAHWEQEKKLYLGQLKLKGSLSETEKSRYSALQDMSYNDFVVQYLGDQPVKEPSQYGTGIIYVGHVGIIQIVNGKPTVVEAMSGKGVQRVPYDSWIAERKGEIFWLGRLDGVSAEKRSAVADIAAAEIGKPYDFWNFNLKDTTGFYCSKLAWYAISSATGVPPDDNPDPERIRWYSPKQLMKSKHIKMVVNPGNYGSN